MSKKTLSKTQNESAKSEVSISIVDFPIGYVDLSPQYQAEFRAMSGGVIPEGRLIKILMDQQRQDVKVAERMRKVLRIGDWDITLHTTNKGNEHVNSNVVVKAKCVAIHGNSGGLQFRKSVLDAMSTKMDHNKTLLETLQEFAAQHEDKLT